MTVDREHGKSYISVDNEIITVKAVGAFNIEGIIKTINELKVVIESFHEKEFKLLFDYCQIEGGTPEVFEKINECNIWLNSQNMIAKAVVINSTMHLTILESRTPARKVHNTKNFDDRKTAINWLQAQASQS